MDSFKLNIKTRDEAQAVFEEAEQFSGEILDLPASLVMQSLVRFYWDTGVRLMQAINLYRVDVSLARQQVLIRGRNGRELQLLISRKTAALLQNLMSMHDSPRVFDGLPRQLAIDNLEKLAYMAGLTSERRPRPR